METDPDVILQTTMANIMAFIPDFTIAVIILLASIYLAKFFSRLLVRWLTSREADPELTKLLETIAKWSMYVLGTTMALNQVGFDLSAFLTGLGIIGFTIGFAIQDVSKNFIAGLLLLIEQPFDIGDAIEVAGFGGTVRDVDLRATEMMTFDGRIVQIPNADIFTSAIVNYTRAPKRRVEMNIGVAYGTDLEKTREVVLSTVQTVEGILKDPAAQVVFNEFGNSSINFTLYYWIDTSITGMFGAQDAGLVALNKAFTQEQIDIPFPISIVRLEKE